MTTLILGPIIGGLSPTSAYLWGRTDNTARLHAWLGRQSDLSDAKFADTSPLLTQETGFCGFATLKELTPETKYYFALTLDSGHPAPTLAPYASFTTFPPDKARRSFSFAFGSCFLPSERTPGRIFQKLEQLRQLQDQDPAKALRFIMLLGDQIYADDWKHNNLGFVARSVEEYREVYAHAWSQPRFRELLKNLPAYMTLDDHEVDDDWTWTDYDRETARIPFWDRLKRLRKPISQRTIFKKDIQAALQAYWEHQGMHAREYIDRLYFDAEIGKYPLKLDDQTSLAYSFNYGAAAFFVLDTRTRRIKKSLWDRTMLGEGQMQALKNWLLEADDYPVKFVVTSCALLYRMSVDISFDRWAGFRKDRRDLLNFLATNEIEGVFFLAGDLHSAHAVSAELKNINGRTIPIWEFCSTPFEQNTNWLAKGTYLPLVFDPIKNQRLHFVCAEHNFGVVQVEYDNRSKPKVSFEVHRNGGAPPIILDTTI